MFDFRERNQMKDLLNSLDGRRYIILSTPEDTRDERITQFMEQSERDLEYEKMAHSQLTDEEALEKLEAAICHQLHKCAEGYEWLRNYKSSKRRPLQRD